MNENQWQTSDDPVAMADFLTRQAVHTVDGRPVHAFRPCFTDRKARLFCAALIRLCPHWHNSTEWELIDTVESTAELDTPESHRKRQTAWISVCFFPASLVRAALIDEPDVAILTGVKMARAAHDPENRLPTKAEVAGLLRDHFGNVFRLTPFLPGNDGKLFRWLPTYARPMAAAAYRERLTAGFLDEARLAVLADAIEEDGPDHPLREAIIADLRGRLPDGRPCPLAGRRCRGVWSLDLCVGMWEATKPMPVRFDPR